MIEKMFKRPYALHQTSDSGHCVPEPTVLCSVDSSGLVILSQEGRCLALNRRSIPELCKMLKFVVAERGEVQP